MTAEGIPGADELDADGYFLLLPGETDRTFARLVRKVRVSALRSLLTFPAAAYPSRRLELSTAQAVVKQAVTTHGDQLLRAVGTPEVLAPLLVLRAGIRTPDELIEQLVPHLLLALAQSGALSESVIWTRPPQTLIDDHNGVVYDLDFEVEGLAFGPGGVEVRRENGTFTPLSACRRNEGQLHTLSPTLRFALVDSNPLRDLEEHPDKSGNQISLGTASRDDWMKALRDALTLIQYAIPTWSTELTATLRRLIPVGVNEEAHLSASYREAPGIAYLSLHPNPITMAEAIIHETQHTKLNTLLLLDPVLQNGRSFWASSPVRPDLRPLEGVLLAVHAFLPVAAFHSRLLRLGHPLSRSAWFQQRRQAVLQSNQEAMRVLQQHGAWTRAGTRLFDDLQRLMSALGGPHPTNQSAAAPPEIL